MHAASLSSTPGKSVSYSLITFFPKTLVLSAQVVSRALKIAVAAWLVQVGTSLAAPKSPYLHDFVHAEQDDQPKVERRQQDGPSLRQLREEYRQIVMGQLQENEGSCNAENAVVREEWHV